MLEGFINFKKTKYKVMDQILKPHILKLKDSRTVLNLYIDIKSLINDIYNPKNVDIFNHLSDVDKWILAPELINLAGHYRRYAATRLNMYTNIYFYYSSLPNTTAVDLVPEYKQDIYNKYYSYNVEFNKVSTIVRKNLDNFKLIIDYIPHVYYIDTKCYEPHTVPYHYIMSDKDNGLHLILSNDKVHWNNCKYKPDTTMVMTLQGDASRVMEAHELIGYLVDKDSDNLIEIHYSYYTHFLNLIGYKKYNLSGKHLCGATKALKLFRKYIQSYELINDININIPYIYELFDKDNKDKLIATYNLIEPSKAYEMIDVVDKIHIYDDVLIDLTDPASLRNLNERYFSRSPIIYDDILMGESYGS